MGFFFFFFFFLQIQRVRPTLFPLAMTPWHLKNNMTPTTKCCCWLALSKAVRFGEGGETAKGRRVGVSQRVGPGHHRDSSLRDLSKLGRGKRDGDERSFHPVSLKTSLGLPLMAGEVFLSLFSHHLSAGTFSPLWVSHKEGQLFWQRIRFHF